MGTIVQHGQYFISGLQQAFQWIRVISLIYSSPVIQKAIAKTICLNGIIYLGALVIIDTIYTDHTIFGYSYMHLTGYPMYMICLLVNSSLFSQIALEAFQVHANEYQRPTTIVTTASMIGNALFYMNCAALVRVLYWVPLIGTFISFFVTCLLMAYYSFEYKWIHLGWSLDQRLRHVEQNWAFFFGFGLPAALLTFFLSTLHAGGVFALIYPGYIILATMATLKPVNGPVSTTTTYLKIMNGWCLPDRIPFFWPVAKATYFAALLLKNLGAPNILAIMSEKKDQLGKVV
ncbi:etoposide-induced protein 2.4-domain-containing protein [Phascolomyces articulosus]|uniref:Etoposide-induced protein 2.4-domain-containing protein n=1 Tax=Phascolomyces articulosus TaxID=60185 RepID=A0AAD5K8A0_9FUNG|nr:etoposide-induced protein 2.4-domain-containing protein [Phascolomyces articulosus]